MPERAEIALMSDYLKTKMSGLKCDKMAILPKSRYWNEPLYSSMEISDNLCYKSEICRVYKIESNVQNVCSRGKKIIIELLNSNNETIIMVSSCGMDGRWSNTISANTSIILMFDDFNVYFDDITNKGLFSICKYLSPEYNHIFKDVGPDLMTEEVDVNVYFQVIRNARISKLKIMHFMMEQKYLSGIGNYLRSEILYKARINPHRKLETLSDNDVYSLFYFSKLTIWESYKSNGLTIKDYFDPEGNIGSYRCLCYGRDKDDNGFQIIKEDDDRGRQITWCPDVQI